MGTPKKKASTTKKRDEANEKLAAADGREIPTVGQYLLYWGVQTAFIVFPPAISIFVQWLRLQMNEENKELFSLLTLIMPEMFLAVFTFSCNTVRSIYDDRIISRKKRDVFLLLSAIVALASFVFYIIESAVVHFAGSALTSILILAGVLILANIAFGLYLTRKNAKAEIAQMIEDARREKTTQDNPALGRAGIHEVQAPTGSAKHTTGREKGTKGGGKK